MQIYLVLLFYCIRRIFYSWSWLRKDASHGISLWTVNFMLQISSFHITAASISRSHLLENFHYLVIYFLLNLVLDLCCCYSLLFIGTYISIVFPLLWENFRKCFHKQGKLGKLHSYWNVLARLGTARFTLKLVFLSNCKDMHPSPQLCFFFFLFCLS